MREEIRYILVCVKATTTTTTIKRVKNWYTIGANQFLVVENLLLQVLI